jgi:calcineurin-like phosphoesterase family protein
MFSRLTTIRDRNLSLWQSAVDEVVAGIDDPARRKAMREAAALHVLSAMGKASVPDQPPSAASVEAEDPSALAFLSKKLFDSANAQQGGHAALGGPHAFSLTELTGLLRDYSKADILGWAQCAINYAKYLASGAGSPKYVNWKDQVPPDPSYGVLDYRLPDTARIILVGDWGSHMTDNVAMLRQALKRFKPDAIMHLGDVYYSGTAFECKRNVLDVMDSLVKELGLKRPPFFTVPGNHEYYSGGAAFYDMIGKINTGIAGARQRASYFCLRTANDKWQFLGMDTGYNDHVPGLSVGPGLQASEAEWHTDKLRTFPGSTILLSHHQLFSANSPINKSGARPFVNEALLGTFSPFFDRIGAWFWGHEHNLVIFKDGQFGLKKGRLVGCSAFQSGEHEDPYEVKFSDVAYIDQMPQLGFSPFGPALQKYYNHAFALLEVSPAKIEVSYFEYPSWDRDFKGNEPDLSAPFHRETIAPTPAPVA